MPHDIHDIVFFIGTIVLIWGPLRMTLSKNPPPISATLSTGLVLTAFAINYASLNFWYSTAAQAINVIFWMTLVIQAWRRRNA